MKIHKSHSFTYQLFCLLLFDVSFSLFLWFSVAFLGKTIFSNWQLAKIKLLTRVLYRSFTQDRGIFYCFRYDCNTEKIKLVGYTEKIKFSIFGLLTPNNSQSKLKVVNISNLYFCVCSLPVIIGLLVAKFEYLISRRLAKKGGNKQ